MLNDLEQIQESWCNDPQHTEHPEYAEAKEPWQEDECWEQEDD